MLLNKIKWIIDNLDGFFVEKLINVDAVLKKKMKCIMENLDLQDIFLISEYHAWKQTHYSSLHFTVKLIPQWVFTGIVNVMMK